jgi:hypothetical protein
MASILPVTVGKLPFLRTVPFHDPDRSVWLERVVIKRGFISEAVLAAVPHNVFAVLCPNRVSIIGGKGSQPTHFSAVRPDCVNVEVLVVAV